MGFVKIGMVALGIGAIYLTGDYFATKRIENKPYRIVEDGGGYALVEKITGRTQPISPDGKVGTLEQRMDGVFDDMRKDFPKSWDALGKELRKNMRE